MLDHDRVITEACAALHAAAWDRRETAARVHAMASQRVENATLAVNIGADRYHGVLNALDFRALDVAFLQAEAAELAARQEWSAAHWEVLRLVGGLRSGNVSATP